MASWTFPTRQCQHITFTRSNFLFYGSKLWPKIRSVPRTSRVNHWYFLNFSIKGPSSPLILAITRSLNCFQLLFQRCLSKDNDVTSNITSPPHIHHAMSSKMVYIHFVRPSISVIWDFEAPNRKDSTDCRHLPKPQTCEEIPFTQNNLASKVTNTTISAIISNA